MLKRLKEWWKKQSVFDSWPTCIPLEPEPPELPRKSVFCFECRLKKYDDPKCKGLRICQLGELALMPDYESITKLDKTVSYPYFGAWGWTNHVYRNGKQVRGARGEVSYSNQGI